MSKLEDLLTPSLLKVLRSVALFTVGIGGVIYEIVVDHTERPTLLILLGAMVGLPAFLKTDEKRRSNGGGSTDSKGNAP